jgi:cytochrome oxidase assembly protein ShyY1
MSRRFPFVATLVVAAAIGAMVALGFWQLRRAHENQRLQAQYQAASKLPPIAYPTAPLEGPLPLFRWATGFCQRVVGNREVGGRNRQGEVGWAHIVDCATGAEGPGMTVELGWSKDPNTKVKWNGGLVSGVIVPDRLHRMRLVAATPPPGLQAAALPTADTAMTVTPSRNRFYALQWFAFAAIALVIYALALRKRLKEEPRA